MTESRLKAFVLVVLVWAIVYLPNLGLEEFKRQEGRRVLPAVAMLQGHNYFLPSLNGEEYYNKPPGMNWLIAASFALTGVQSELTARLPSVLMMLAFVTMLIWMRSDWLPLGARLAAALIYLTSMGLVDYGRYAEIDASFTAMTGMAVLWWLNMYSRNASRWLLWMPAALLLAAGALVKVPLDGVIFYFVVCAVLAYQRRLRELLRVEHLLAIVLMAGICLAWVFLAYRESAQSGDMFDSWAKQLLVRAAPDEEHASFWPRNAGANFLNFLPWLVLVPMLFMKRFTSRIPAERVNLFRGLRLGMILSFVFIIIWPATLQRYSLPVVPLAGMLLGWVLALHVEPAASDKVLAWALVAAAAAAVPLGIVVVLADSHQLTLPLQLWPAAALGPGGAGAFVAAGVAVAIFIALLLGRRALQGGINLALAMAAVTTSYCLLHSTMMTPQSDSAERYRTSVARQIAACVPPGEEIYAYKPGRQTMFFYIRPPLRFVDAPDGIDARCRYILVGQSVVQEPTAALVGKLKNRLKDKFQERMQAMDQERQDVLARLGPAPRVLCEYKDDTFGVVKLLAVDKAATTSPTTRQSAGGDISGR